MTTDTPTPRTDALAEANRGKPCSQSVDCDFARTLERDLSECRAALLELVACKDLKDKIDAGVSTFYDGRFRSFEELETAKRKYAYKKPLAWSAARAILAKGEGK